MGDTPAKETILAIDDAPENLDIIKNLLVPDYTVKGAINGAMALKIAAAQPPTLILLDIMMPDMDGYEVCRRLKADPAVADIPVIFLTAQDTLMEEAKGLMLGAVDFILKPVEPKQLVARIRVHITQARRWKSREEALLCRIAALEAELDGLRRGRG
ncbi:MAG: response regulator [Magnetococcales bacterium]|nr:response regulator [Magnetococcales bacterium]